MAIRNLSTLVLLNGRRLGNSAFSNGAAVDVNTIPLSMIERIEVLKDGASALYGLDSIDQVHSFEKAQFDRSLPRIAPLWEALRLGLRLRRQRYHRCRFVRS